MKKVILKLENFILKSERFQFLGTQNIKLEMLFPLQNYFMHCNTKQINVRKTNENKEMDPSCNTHVQSSNSYSENKTNKKNEGLYEYK